METRLYGQKHKIPLQSSVQQKYKTKPNCNESQLRFGFSMLKKAKPEHLEGGLRATSKPN